MCVVERVVAVSASCVFEYIFTTGFNFLWRALVPIEYVFPFNFLMFMFKVMDETNTQIAWPSKLKIGAKSKKGIHTQTDAIVTAVALVTRHKLRSVHQQLFLTENVVISSC